jgi:SAM-dependent methyltransferase
MTDASRRTLQHYERNAESFCEGTRDHDVSQNIEALVSAITAPPPFRVLDLGCGPGRDLKAFLARGHLPTGLDGCARFVEMARAEARCEVWQQDFLALTLPSAAFDGVFANASLFHVPDPREQHEGLPGGVAGELERATIVIVEDNAERTFDIGGENVEHYCHQDIDRELGGGRLDHPAQDRLRTLVRLLQGVAEAAGHDDHTR